MNKQMNPAADQAPAEHSLDAIAADLIATPQAIRPAPKPRARPPVEGTPPPAPKAPAAASEPPVEGDDTDDDLPLRRGERDFMDDLLGEDDTPPNDPEDGDEDEDDLDDAAFDRDDRRVRVKRDGKIEEVSLADLKKSWSGTKAIDVRVQEAAEERNAAKAAREEAAQYVTQVRALHDRIATVYQHYNSVLISPRVQQPDPQMRAHDPLGYMEQMEDFRQDQARMDRERQEVQQTLQNASQVFQENRKVMLQSETDALLTKMPGLKKAENAKVFKQRIADIGAAHGFKPEEIAMADDHRLLTLAAEAAAYRELKASLSGKRQTREATTKRRPMPTRGDNRQKGDVSRKAARARKAMAKAMETGSVDDVAATLLL